MIFRSKARTSTSRMWSILLGSCAVLLLLAGGGIWYISRLVRSADILSNTVVRNQVIKEIGTENSDLLDLVPVFLGFTEPQTYLVLFLNNTELRPGGGFIGSYATVRVDKGAIEILAVDGTENLDRNAPDTWRVTPPTPITTHLGLTRWFFRDSNWSPDFAVSAEQALAFYTAEGGVVADAIDGVVAVTPTVVETLLRLVGPVTVHGIEFTSDNVTETLEYEVEYAYEDRGVHVYDRKDIIEPLFLTILDRMKERILSSYHTYLETLATLADQKQILLYHRNPSVDQILSDRDWDGRVHDAPHDYLLWVDANLGSLKTDHVLRRSLSYRIVGKEGDRYRAEATMTYVHNGTFDWRTTRYITYARVYSPKGSTFESVDGTLKSGARIAPEQVDQGVELEKTWFGTSFSIEPGQTKSLTFTYLLPESIGADGAYTLLVQKQLGTIDTALTLDLDFATLLQSASPGEVEKEWHDGVYRYVTDLKEDREFAVQL